MKNNKYILWLLIFLVAWTFMQNINQTQEGSIYLTQTEVGIATQKTEYRRGKAVIAEIQNNTDQLIEIPIPCGEEPLDIYQYENGTWSEQQSHEETSNCKPTTLKIEPGKNAKIDYKNWAYRLFKENARYQISLTLTLNNEEKKFTSNEFTVEPRTALGRLWLNGIYSPILNALIYFIKITPGHSLGLGIVLLTLAIRTLLLIPSQRAIPSQKKNQKN